VQAGLSRLDQEWFNTHEPFDMNEKKLHSLSSGLMAMDGYGINPDKPKKLDILFNSSSMDEVFLGINQTK